MSLQNNPIKEMLSWLIFALPTAAEIQEMFDGCPATWRETMVKRLTWGVPFAEALHAMQNHNRYILEVAAGSGYYSSILRAHGMVVASTGRHWSEKYECDSHNTFGQVDEWDTEEAVHDYNNNAERIRRDVLLVWGNINNQEITTELIDALIPGQRLYLQSRRDPQSYQPFLLHLAKTCDTVLTLEAPHWRPYRDVFSVHVKR
jgi:hypothetical protein